MIGTYIISSNKATILKKDNIVTVAMKLISGSATFCGSQISESFSGKSHDISLVLNEPVIITDEKIIDGLIIDGTSGTIHIITQTA